ncbi:histidine kinase [Georgenia yuyongxinii]|uniref:histidine kinase n=1 Tax=Georgenia yuyongxinii TaxID=2589797 RepID=A0A5B8C514_9MICO|nr:histidine kinase [Georgenia yuyongxinii]QDC24415.1 histidine kinase [Georgenia yuyongxinii]
MTPRGAAVPAAIASAALFLGAGSALHLMQRGTPTGAGVTDWWLMAVSMTVAFATTGGWLARRRSQLVIGWLMLSIGVTASLSMLSLEYGVYGLDHPGVPGSDFLLWVGNWAWSAAVVAVAALLPPLLPEGRLPNRTWWPVLVLGSLSVVAASVQWALMPYEAWSPVIADAGAVNPVGADVVATPAAQTMFALVVLAGPLAAAGGLVVRWRASQGATRQQLKWILLGLVWAVVLFAAGFALGPLVTAAAVLPVPAGIVVAVLRYGLWDVDVAISRSLLYLALAAAVATVYVTVVGLLGGLLGATTGAPVLATALVAVLVEPLHRRLRRVVNRVVHGSMSDPLTALAEMGSRAAAAHDASTVGEHLLPRLLASTASTMHLGYAAVELADGSVISSGEVGGEHVRVPLVHDGADVGFLVVGGRRAGLSRRDRDRLARLASQVAVAAHNVLLVNALRRSGEELVNAREEERRRLHRELHDGVGPSLAALALTIELARDLVVDEPKEAVELLDRTLPRLKGTVDDVRTVVLGLRPPALDDLGLAGSVRELAAGFAGPSLLVRVQVDGDLSDLPAATEVATYRIVAEALANASRHADAGEIVVWLERYGDEVSVDVVDDGRGIEVSRPGGVGLQSMTGRATEVGGRLLLGPGRDGRGTSVRAVLPAVTP